MTAIQERPSGLDDFGYASPPDETIDISYCGSSLPDGEPRGVFFDRQNPVPHPSSLYEAAERVRSRHPSLDRYSPIADLLERSQRANSISFDEPIAYDFQTREPVYPPDARVFVPAETLRLPPAYSDPEIIMPRPPISVETARLMRRAANARNGSTPESERPEGEVQAAGGLGWLGIVMVDAIGRLAGRRNAQRAANVLITGSLITAACSGSVPTPEQPQPQPGVTQSGLSGPSETGQLISLLPSWQGLQAETAEHGVDASLCSPDRLGSLVEKGQLSVEIVDALATISATALNNTPEPDGLVALACNVSADAAGKSQVQFFFTGEDANGDGDPDARFIPSKSGILLPAVVTDGKLQAAASEPPTASVESSASQAPDYPGALGGGVPEELQSLIDVENRSIDASLAAAGLSLDVWDPQHVWRGSGNDFRIGSVVIRTDGQAALWVRFDDTGALAWRPDLRLETRPWHWEEVVPPSAGGEGKLVAFFDPDSEAPQLLYVSPDGSRMIGWLDNEAEAWRDAQGAILLPPPTEPPPPPPTLAPTEGAGVGCTSEARAQEVLTAFKQTHPEVKLDGFTPDVTKSIGGDWVSFDYKAILVGSYGDFEVEAGGKLFSGKCLVVVTPDHPDNPVSLVVLTKRDGEEINPLINRNIESLREFNETLAEMLGKLIEFDVEIAVKKPEEGTITPLFKFLDADSLPHFDGFPVLYEMEEEARKKGSLGLSVRNIDI